MSSGNIVQTVSYTHLDVYKRQDRGYLDDVPLNKIGDFETGLLAYARANHSGLIDQINASGDFNDEIEAGLKKIAEDFKPTFVG